MRKYDIYYENTLIKSVFRVKDKEILEVSREVFQR